MDAFDSQGRITPVGVADQGIVSKKIMDNEGQGQGPKHQPQKKAASVELPENEEKDAEKENHVIDIIV